ncbi:MAG: chemotaxis protein CheW [Pseudomonadota bacterium]
MENDIRSLMILLGAQNLLIPSSIIAEVIRYRPSETTIDNSDWVTGFITWRDQRVPVLSTEKIFKTNIKHIAASFDAHIMIFYVVSQAGAAGFYGLPVPSMPQTLNINEESFSEHQMLDEDEESSALLASALVDGDKLVYLPDLALLEEKALEAAQ